MLNGPLAIWDTTVGREINAPVWPDGRYRLRLRVVRTDYNYDEYFVTDLFFIQYLCNLIYNRQLLYYFTATVGKPVDLDGLQAPHSQILI